MTKETESIRRHILDRERRITNNTTTISARMFMVVLIDLDLVALDDVNDQWALYCARNKIDATDRA